MELNSRLLAFLEQEMKQIKNDRDRRSDERQQASSVLGRIEGEIELEKEQHYNGDTKTTEIFS